VVAGDIVRSHFRTKCLSAAKFDLGRSVWHHDNDTHAKPHSGIAAIPDAKFPEEWAATGRPSSCPWRADIQLQAPKSLKDPEGVQP
jgi:hypothetical protein